MSTSAPDPNGSAFALLDEYEANSAANDKAADARRAERAQSEEWLARYTAARDAVSVALAPVYLSGADADLSDVVGSICDSLLAAGAVLAERDARTEPCEHPASRRLVGGRPVNPSGCVEPRIAARLAWAALPAVAARPGPDDGTGLDGADRFAAALVRDAIAGAANLRLTIERLIALPLARSGFGGVLPLLELFSPGASVWPDALPHELAPRRSSGPPVWRAMPLGDDRTMRRLAKLRWLAWGWSNRPADELADIFPGLVLTDEPQQCLDQTAANSPVGSPMLIEAPSTAAVTPEPPEYECEPRGEVVAVAEGGGEPCAIPGTDGPTEGYCFQFNGTHGEFTDSQRRYYRLLVLMWPSYRTRGSKRIDDLMGEWKHVGGRETITALSLKNYCGPLSEILAGQFGVPARLEKSGNCIRWRDAGPTSPKEC